MKSSRSKHLEPSEFVVSPLNYYPRIDLSFSLLLLAAIVLGPGLFLVLNDLPETSSYLAQIVLQGIPTIVGAVLLIFATVGLITGIVGSRRKENNSIDLKVRASGIIVRGGHVIPWDSVSAVVSHELVNDANVRVLWDRADLNRSLDIIVSNEVDVPCRKTKDGRWYIRVMLRHYPARDYIRLFEAILDQLENRNIPVEVDRKQVQF